MIADVRIVLNAFRCAYLELSIQLASPGRALTLLQEQEIPAVVWAEVVAVALEEARVTVEAEVAVVVEDAEDKTVLCNTVKEVCL